MPYYTFRSVRTLRPVLQDAPIGPVRRTPSPPRRSPPLKRPIRPPIAPPSKFPTRQPQQDPPEPAPGDPRDRPHDRPPAPPTLPTDADLSATSEQLIALPPTRADESRP